MQGKPACPTRLACPLVRKLLLIVLAPAAAAAIALYASDPYAGVTVDSGEYLAVAEGLADGHGLTMPYVNYDEPFRVLEPASASR